MIGLARCSRLGWHLQRSQVWSLECSFYISGPELARTLCLGSGWLGLGIPLVLTWRRISKT